MSSVALLSSIPGNLLHRSRRAFEYNVHYLLGGHLTSSRSTEFYFLYQLKLTFWSLRLPTLSPHKALEVRLSRLELKFIPVADQHIQHSCTGSRYKNAHVRMQLAVTTLRSHRANFIVPSTSIPRMRAMHTNFFFLTQLPGRGITRCDGLFCFCHVSRRKNCNGPVTK